MAKKKDSSEKKKVIKKTAVKKPVPVKKKATAKKTVVKIPKAKVVKPTPTKGKKAVTKKPKDASQLLTDAIVEGILEVKGRNISVLNLTTINNRVCDYFIICQADSNTQVKAIAASVEEMVKKQLENDHIEKKVLKIQNGF